MVLQRFLNFGRSITEIDCFSLDQWSLWSMWLHCWEWPQFYQVPHFKHLYQLYILPSILNPENNCVQPTIKKWELGSPPWDGIALYWEFCTGNNNFSLCNVYWLHFMVQCFISLFLPINCFLWPWGALSLVSVFFDIPPFCICFFHLLKYLFSSHPICYCRLTLPIYNTSPGSTTSPYVSSMELWYSKTRSSVRSAWHSAIASGPLESWTKGNTCMDILTCVYTRTYK